GRNGFFLGCSAYPKCKNTSPVPIGVKCPKCKTGEIIEIRARGRKRPFYGCTNYQNEAKCDFRTWAQPVQEECKQCGADFLVRAGGKANPMLKCANETCDYERPDEGDEESAEAAEARRAAEAEAESKPATEEKAS
ncbi:MAG: topoisomerase DNA-binding C4 zinc finger domain-containing protein, partial [Deltaproteobacteria bacterium]|nr:topoisomerase DNA-binding C4 zinc finger domain-containing protein [Deltaproteobacteria bacterium]